MPPRSAWRPSESAVMPDPAAILRWLMMPAEFVIAWLVAGFGLATGNLTRPER